MLPFSRDQFIAVFAQYNAAIWPAQLVAALLGVVIAIALWRRTARATSIVGVGLAMMWLWTGVAYHAMFFSRINPAALGFAVLFVVQGLLFARAAWAARDGSHTRRSLLAAVLGWALTLYAGVLYPVVGSMSGHSYPGIPTFGVTPCPVVLFTLGVLLIDARQVPRHMLVVPALWSVVGGSAAFLLGIVQDWPLLLGGLAATALLWRRGSRHRVAAVA